jgi:hypothetical protein
MKMLLAATALACSLAACSSQTTTPIQSMSDSGITVAYVDGFASHKDTDKVARNHCSGSAAAENVPVTSGTPLDETAIRYTC